MRVLLIHNHYGSEAPSGENHAFQLERALLESRGHEVRVFERHSDEIRAQGIFGTVRGALATPWNPASFVHIRRIVAAFGPQIVHAHNTFPLISPAVFSAARGAARVLTLHNYRVFCPAAIPMRAGRVCTECIDSKSVLPALQHGCYRGSRLATVPLAASVALHRSVGTWSRQVDAFIALSNFQRERMIQAGLPAHRLHVKPNFYPGNPRVVPWRERHHCVVFAGRLTAEKGLTALLKAWLLWGASAPELRIVGDGQLRAELEDLARGDPSVPISFLGQLTGDDTQEEIARAGLLILPSEGFEGFPMVVREAYALGTPVAVSRIGSLPSIVKDGISGLVFTPASSESLLKTVRRAWKTPGVLERLGYGARAEFETRYSEEKNYQELMQIYDAASATSRLARA